MTRYIKKRDGRKVLFKQEKITNVFKRVLNSTHPDDVLSNDEERLAESLTQDTCNLIFTIKDELSVEQIQDIVQKVLINNGLIQEAKNFITYRNERTAKRDYNSALNKTYRQMLTSKAQDMDLMRENANIDGNSVMGTMLRVGTEATKNFAHEYVLKPEYSYAHKNGDMHIHDLDFSLLTFNCCQVPVGKLLKKGFSTGHGFLRQPKSIPSASSLCCISIQSNQNDMYGGQGVATFEYDLAPYVAKSYAKNLKKVIEIIIGRDIADNDLAVFIDALYEKNQTVFSKESQKEIGKFISFIVKDKVDYCLKKAKSMTENDTYQAMEALVHNLNTMQCLTGDQLVTTSNGEVPIKDIKVGNYVLSRNPNGKLEYKKVVNTFDNGKQTVHRFTLENGTEIKSTFDHRFMTESGTYEPIGALDHVIANNKAVKISKVEELGNEEVYDIEVQDNHNFFVNGCEVSNCRAGAQTPFSSINYGTGTTAEQRMIIKYILKATDEGLGHGETAIFPVQIFRLKKGVNMEKGEPNYDLFQYACAVSAKRLFPNFSFQDVPFNLQYYKEGHPETEIAVMGALAEGYVDLKVYDENGDLKEILNQYKIQDVKDYLLNHSELIDGDPSFIDFDENTKYVNIKQGRLKIADSQTGIVQWVNAKKFMYWNDPNAKWLKISYTYNTSKWLGLTDSVIVTDDHPLCGKHNQNDKFSRMLARDLKVGDFLLTADPKGYDVTIANVEELFHDGIVMGYDFETESDCFNVNSIVSHNCRTRVIGNSAKPENEVYTGRGNFSFTTINLPRLGIEAKGDWDKFYKDFDHMIDLAKDQLLDRFEMISHKHVYNYPFLMQQGVWIDSDNLDLNDEIGEVLKNASISIGFIGLAECLKAMMGKHHGESEEAYQKGLEIIQHLRDKTDGFTKQYNLNFSTFASPAEGLSGRFTRLDKKRYGIIEGVTDREYYTNSFHIPVYFKIPAYKKMQLEGKFHELCNAGAITYIEMDGNLTKNVQAFEDIVKYAGECGISYFSINHAVDRCPICGYTGIIGDECPRCGFREGVGVSLEHLKECGIKLKNI